MQKARKQGTVLGRWVGEGRTNALRAPLKVCWGLIGNRPVHFAIYKPISKI